MNGDRISLAADGRGPESERQSRNLIPLATIALCMAVAVDSSMLRLHVNRCRACCRPEFRAAAIGVTLIPERPPSQDPA